MSPGPETSSPLGQPEFPEELLELRRRLSRTAEDLAGTDIDLALVQDLETAYEELRAADEEVRAQQDQITRLHVAQQHLRAQHERILAVLPVPVLVTDHRGIVQSVNAAAAGFLAMRPARLLRKPIFVFFAEQDRGALRQLLGAEAEEGDSFRRLATVHPRDRDPLDVEVFASRLTGGASEVSWMLLAPTASRSGSARLAAALVRIAALPALDADLQHVIHRAADLCAEALGDGVVASVSLGDPATPTQVASTDVVAQELDGAQIISGEGPGVLAFRTGGVVDSADLRTDERWPDLAVRVRLGVIGTVSVGLRTGDDPTGVLSFYLSGAFDPQMIEDAEVLGSAMSAVLTELALREELEDTARNMQQALASRATIDQAKGIVMADRRCTPDQAFQHLVDLSSTSGMKLREVAQSIVDRASGASG